MGGGFLLSCLASFLGLWRIGLDGVIQLWAFNVGSFSCPSSFMGVWSGLVIIPQVIPGLESCYFHPG